MKTFEILKHLQADAIVLFMKVHNFHWNVKGTDFFNVHKATEEIYEGFADMFDDLAERIVQLGHHPLVTLSEALKLTRVKEETKTSFHSKDIFKEILEDYKHLEKEFKELSNTAEKEGDKVTVTYADDQLAKLQKSIWMLEAHLA
ncbi:DNA starvation/stationary phase protection protein [Helicobacter pylori]|uniref:DNA starvation/stationary phase protection protein n=1 Tax=Helicobacter pylori TaxID=210 RepID=UPI001128354F|nr:DNA starvation/stationary phase protection protein [Helicobacter pylori]TPH40845.1 DNA starvation/stationary phase protection protein [Helicobacter pylori]GHP25329.1 DNA protection during starvation protein [Helicobacter pylori]GHQ29191.1 DNA protection during starvation protein [Helicobacter pylori]GHR76593.1 DNA protection during starvation protein [Helicobacter pylori]